MKNCPNCKVAHADYADTCECGFSFKEQLMGRGVAPRTPLGTKIVMWGAIIVIAPVFAAIVKNAVGLGPRSSANEIPDENYERGLQHLAKELNAGLPMIVDTETRIDSVSAGPGKKVTYFYTLTGLEAKSVDAADLRRSLEPVVTKNVCKSPDMSNFRADNVIVSFEYKDRNGNPLMGIAVYPRDCVN